MYSTYMYVFKEHDSIDSIDLANTNFFKSPYSSEQRGLLKDIMKLMATDCIHRFFDLCTI